MTMTLSKAAERFFQKKVTFEQLIEMCASDVNLVPELTKSTLGMSFPVGEKIDPEQGDFLQNVRPRRDLPWLWFFEPVQHAFLVYSPVTSAAGIKDKLDARSQYPFPYSQSFPVSVCSAIPKAQQIKTVCFTHPADKAILVSVIAQEPGARIEIQRLSHEAAGLSRKEARGIRPLRPEELARYLGMAPGTASPLVQLKYAGNVAANIIDERVTDATRQGSLELLLPRDIDAGMGNGEYALVFKPAHHNLASALTRLYRDTVKTAPIPLSK